MTCIFCEITKHEKEAEIEYEDEEFVVFKDINPKAPVHLLIVPKLHIDSIKSASENHRELLGKIIILAKSIAEKRGLGGYKLIFNVGREGGQIINHLHLHLIGGWK